MEYFSLFTPFTIFDIVQVFTDPTRGHANLESS